MKNIKENFPSIIMLFFIFSLSGFLMETIGDIIIHNKVEDRGFLILPLCPIYGFAVAMLLIFIGLPFRGRWKKIYYKVNGIKRIILKSLTLLVYSITCTIVAVIFELLTGQLFYYLFNIKLWNYHATEDTFLNGFISKEISNYWFLLILVFAPLVVTPLYKFLRNINQSKLKIIALILSILLICDFIISIIFIIITGDKVNIFNYN